MGVLFENDIEISIHALLAESDEHGAKQSIETLDISIHALLAESDPYYLRLSNRVRISIHALLAESDLTGFEIDKEYFAFLSTLSLRRATVVRYVRFLPD